MYSQTFSLDELSRRCDLASYILSYWQMQFPQLRNADGSLKSAFTINDEALVMRIKKLLYVDHLTIEDARERLLEERAFPVTSLRPTGVLNSQPTRTETPTPQQAAHPGQPTPAASVQPVGAPAQTVASAQTAPAPRPAEASPVIPSDLRNLMQDASRRAVAEALTQANQRCQQMLADQKTRYESLLNGAKERAQAAQTVADGKVAAAEEEVRRAQAAMREAQERAAKIIQEAQQRAAEAEAAAEEHVKAVLAEAEARVSEAAESSKRHTDEILAQKKAEIEHLQAVCRQAYDALQALTMPKV